MTLFHPFLILHVTAGLGAVVVGFIPLLTRKGSRAHRLWGQLFVGLMTTLLACAWVMTMTSFVFTFPRSSKSRPTATRLPLTAVRRASKADGPSPLPAPASKVASKSQ